MATSREEVKIGKADDFLIGGSEMAERTRALDWSKTPVGPMAGWPQSLKTAVSICLGSRYPIVIWWGNPAYTMFYNDAYIPFLGVTKHPGWLGKSGRECWSEIWPTIGPMLEGVFATGEATWSEDLLLVMRRNLPREETYFTFSYSPIQNDAGAIGGIFCACYETTGRVIGERRLRTLRDLSRMVVEAKAAEEACEVAARSLAENPADIPFALIYLLEGESHHACLVATTGIEAGSASAPNRIDLQASTDRSAKWPLRRVLDTATAELVPDLTARFGPLPGGPWPEAPESALILPISAPGQTRPTGFLVTGLSPVRVIDSDYRSFFDLIAGHVGAAIANARAYEEERRRAEALAEIDRAKTAFFSNVSHEFRTPLSLMLGPLEDTLAQTNGLPAADRERLEVAHRNSLRLLKLVNTLLDFSRIEAGRIQASYEPADLAAFTAELSSVFRSAIERAGMRLVVNCRPLDEPVYVDREMWEKIVLNLLSNAFKFTFDGEIEVGLRREGDHAELTVRDTGTGIPADELPHLFERFHRVKGARGRTFEGSGIGLALVHELVKLHGGTVRVESEVDCGSAFIVSIPLGKAHLPAGRIRAARSLVSTCLRGGDYVEEALRWLPSETERRREEETERSREEVVEKQEEARQSLSVSPSLHPTVTPSSARVLIADDNADMREYVRRLLGERYEVEAVTDGLAALNAARERPPDLVLTDVMMPGLDGFALLRELRADERLKTVPVIMLSARAGEEACVEGMEAGVDDYLIKPFSARELLARVSSRLELAQMRARLDEERAALLVREREAREEAETLNQVARVLAGELDLQKLAQSVTDAGVKLTGAKFGAFFYNVVNEQGEAYMLYTLSGAPREAFEKFGIPRNTPLFERTFRGTDVVRSDDILKHPDHGKNPPHYGMPRGHLPVRSYLAVPVASRSGEVLGGLFFGHPEPGIFTERAERIAVNIAVQAAVAIDNARLFAEAKTEIAQRKQAEAAAAQLAAIVESSDDAIISKDLNGIITSWNRGAEKLFGYTAAEVIGKPVTILIPPDRGDEEPYILERIRRGEQIDHYETVRRRKDGSEIYISLTVSPIRDKSGKVIGASKISRDVTERKRAEAALRESEERFRKLADNTPVMIWVNGPTGCEFVNRECLEFLGVGEEDVLGHDWAQFIHPKDREDYVNAYLEAVSRRGRFEAEFRFRRRDGEYRWMRSVGASRIEGGEYKGYVGISSDIHESRRAEETVRAAYEQESAARAEAEAANRSKDEFLAVVSHELRSPINAINGWVKLLREGQLDPDDVDKALMVIERNSLAQTRLVEDLLDSARIVTGKLRLELGPLDINPILADALDVAREPAAAKGVELRASYSPRPMVVTGDATRLQQIVWNLLSNAIKFTPDGGHIELRAERAKDHIRIIVSDTGEGIQPEFLPYVFDRFRQADSPSSQRHGGLGLGLALVKHLAELHGGKVEATSAGAGCGATFTVTLPLATQSILGSAAPPALAASAASAASDGLDPMAAGEAWSDDATPLPPGITIAGVRVLVVDDQEDARDMLSEFLSHYGAIVTTVSSGAEALAVLSDPPDGAGPDILICDIMMPKEDGYEVMRRVRALEAERGVPTSQQLPAIALTALAGSEDRVCALKAGFQSHVPKPVERVELILVIASIVGLWR